MTKINWSEHVTRFRSSSQTLATYCSDAGIKLENFRYHLYKSKPKIKHFQKFEVATELVISRDGQGGLSLRGFDASQLPQIVGAWSNALSD